MRDKIVTLRSLNFSKTGSESLGASPGQAETPEDQQRKTRYNRIMQKLEDATEENGDDVMITVQDREASLAMSTLATASGRGLPLASGGQEVQFQEGVQGGDLRWVMAKVEEIRRDGLYPIMRPSTMAADTMQGDLRVAMAADWGTGLYGAPRTAATIREMAAARKFDIALHLGDVYYSGTEDEVEERFIKIWPDDAATVNRAVNGNHEMYCGGLGYFKKILPKFKQESSYFAIQNEHWVLVGLDTAYVDHDMDATQVEWLNTIVEQKGDRQVVLFSHHQPFAQLGDQGPKLQAALKPLLDGRRIRAWYWGHQHDCIVYDEHDQWKMYGRCLGNGGIPSVRNKKATSAPASTSHPGAGGASWRRLEQTADAPGCLVLDGKNTDMRKPEHQNKFVPHGFMTLEFTGQSLIERVLLSNGTEVYSNTIT